jgi:5'-methylthioadenosine phosphorylase
MVTDFDCWHPDHDAVTVQDINAYRQCGEGKAPGGAPGARFPTGARAVSDRLRPRPRRCFITAPEARDPERLKKLDAIAGRVLNSK